MIFLYLVFLHVIDNVTTCYNKLTQDLEGGYQEHTALHVDSP